jgi:hypothetical protein
MLQTFFSIYTNSFFPFSNSDQSFKDDWNCSNAFNNKFFWRKH